METFLHTFKRIIRESNYDNTYKMAWAKALVEIASLSQNKSEFTKVYLKELALPILKYYWNQTIFFDLIQGSNLSKPPKILQLTKLLIEAYKKEKNDTQPIIFDKAKIFLDEKMKNELDVTIHEIVRTLKENVSYRFLHVNGKLVDNVYFYSKGSDYLLLETKKVNQLAEFKDDLYDLINYRWSLILETFNSSPRINKKVRIMDIDNVPRSNLTRFDEYLNLENEEHICFICGKPIKDEDLSRDHVIPWSYLYSDDLWNIVYVHKSCNSIKSNVLPNEKIIAKLKERNKRLQSIIHEKLINNKISQELDIAIDKDFVDKFFIGCQQ